MGNFKSYVATHSVPYCLRKNYARLQVKKHALAIICNKQLIFFPWAIPPDFLPFPAKDSGRYRFHVPSTFRQKKPEIGGANRARKQSQFEFSISSVMLCGFNTVYKVHWTLFPVSLSAPQENPKSLLGMEEAQIFRRFASDKSKFFASHTQKKSPGKFCCCVGGREEREREK